jgi:CheY-like chemotaxis protein
VMVARHVLERLGYVVHSENDPLVALELFGKRSGEFDLLLTDLTMPRMDGLQLSESIRRICADIPILLMTGFGGDQTRSRMKELGINGLVPKPSTVDVLGTAVRRALDGEGE